MKVTILVGNPNPKSRTLRVASVLVEKLLTEDEHDIETIDLADHVDQVFRWPSEVMDALTARVASSDLVIVASPTYKASYTGLLKAFLDRYPTNGLSGVVAIPVMTGGDRTHSMGPDVNLAPLLVELGASIPARGFYFVASELDRLDEIATAQAALYARAFAALRKVTTRPDATAETGDDSGRR